MAINYYEETYLDEIISSHEKNIPLEYLAIEDLSHKQWIFYRKKDKATQVVPFGEIVNGVLNYYHKTGDPINVCNQGDEPTYSKTMTDFIEYLRSFIREMPSLKRKYSSVEYKRYCVTAWKKFRDCNCRKVWEMFVSSCNNIYSPLSDESTEILTALHKCVEEQLCIYHDEILIVENNSPVLCRAFCISDQDDIFGWDLYHVLMEHTTVPQVCPRCGSFHLPKTNRFKYCHDCSADKAGTRKIYRENNPERDLHKRINDKLHTLKEYKTNSAELNKFMNESNYYWDIVRGKEPATPAEPWYDLNITTKEQYQAWLEKKLEEYSYHKKK